MIFMFCIRKWNLTHLTFSAPRTLAPPMHVPTVPNSNSSHGSNPSVPGYRSSSDHGCQSLVLWIQYLQDLGAWVEGINRVHLYLCISPSHMQVEVLPVSSIVTPIGQCWDSQKLFFRYVYSAAGGKIVSLGRHMKANFDRVSTLNTAAQLWWYGWATWKKPPPGPPNYVIA